MDNKKYYDEEGNEVNVRTKKKGGCLKWAVIIAGALILLGMCSAMVADDTSQHEEGNTPPPPIEETEQEYVVGDVVPVGNLEVAVNSLSNQQVVGSYSTESAGSGNYLLIDMTVTNVGHEAVTVDSNNFKLIKGETVYQSDGVATLKVNEDSTSFFLNQLNPESKLSGVVAFDIGEESVKDETLKLEVSGGFVSGDKEYIYINK